ncbi:hypothetical protein L0337_24545 [candidate division KSB1 bacterium]|nr:hypothetical protein [candidate division KSB1 bacterium]
MKQNQRLKIGAAVLAIGALSLSAASIAMLAQGPDVTTHIGRLLCAGALANFSLSLIWALIAIFPLRRGEKWAFWAFCLPILLYGIPMLILDATNVEPSSLVSTLAPQVLGLSMALVGLFLVAPGVFRKPTE